MEEKIINNVKDFFSHILSLEFKKEHVLFRGVSDADKHKLIPRIGRSKIGNEDNCNQIADDEKYLLDWFKTRSIPFLDNVPKNDLEWMVTAQHYGLPTRLLDWTLNPLVAAFFAVEKSWEKDAAIYIYNLNDEEILINPEEDGIDPFNMKKDVFVLYPKHIDLHIVVQSGVFTVHRNPQIGLENDKITRIRIKKNICTELKEKIDIMGINKLSLFPSLDNLSDRLKITRGFK